MRFWRKKPPSGEEVSEQYALGMQAMEAWYHDFVIWAYSYISLLEKRLEHGDGAGCDQCKYRHDKSVGGGDKCEVPQMRSER